MKHLDHPDHIIKYYEKNTQMAYIWKKVERLALENIEHDCRFWDPYIFAPHSVWVHALGVKIPEHDKHNIDIYAQDLQFMGTFRYTKDVYKFDTTLVTHLINTPVEDVNALALTRLPEYCIYISLNGELTFKGKNILGFYAVYDDDFALHKLLLFKHIGEVEAVLLKDYPNKLRLRFLYEDDEKDNIYATSIPLRDGNIHDIWKQTVDIKNLVSSFGRVLFHNNEMLPDDEIDLLKKALSILFYLCSDQPEIKDKNCNKISKIPYYEKDKPKRIFSPPRIRYWDVGKQLGKKLARHHTGCARGAMPPHLRRAHWHGFWKGSKDDKVMYYKWLPPIFVGKLHDKEAKT